MIPKIIHLCWLSGDPFPDDIRMCLLSWKEHISDYKIWLWGKAPEDCLGLDVEVKTFDLDSVIWTKQAFEAKKYAFAADYIRLYALYNFGGIYLDADVLIYKRFDELLSLPYFIGYDQIRAFEAAVIGCEAGCLWVKDIFDSYNGKEFVKKDGNWDMMTLPWRFHHVLVDCGYRFRRLHEVRLFHVEDKWMYVFDNDFFNSRTEVEVRRTSKSFCAHNYAGSWQSPKNQKDLKDYLPISMLRIVFAVGHKTWARNKFKHFQIPFEDKE